MGPTRITRRGPDKVAMRTSISYLQTNAVLVLLVALLSLRAPLHGEAQSAQTFPDISHALEGIRQTFHVSTGFENAVGDLDKTPVTLDLSANDVARVLNTLIAQRCAYGWRLEDGFYDVYPKLKADSFSQVEVANFGVTDASLIEAVEAIDKLPKLQQWLTHRHMRRGDLIGGSILMQPRGAPAPPRKRQSLALKNVLVRTILNQVFSDFGETHWVVWHEGQDISIFFSPQSL